MKSISKGSLAGAIKPCSQRLRVNKLIDFLHINYFRRTFCERLWSFHIKDMSSDTKHTLSQHCKVTLLVCVMVVSDRTLLINLTLVLYQMHQVSPLLCNYLHSASKFYLHFLQYSSTANITQHPRSKRITVNLNGLDLPSLRQHE